VKTKLDPITYEVIRNGLLAGAAEMKVLVMRSSYATLWREAGDLSCAIMNIKGEMICQGPADIPAQLGPLPFSMQGILAKLDEPPPEGHSSWTGSLVAQMLGDVSEAQVWRVLRRYGIHLQRRRSWCVSTDPQFAQKAADIVGMYLDPPDNAVVISVDEKPAIQALERAQGWLRLPNGEALRGHTHEYKRHGTTTLFAALEVHTGIAHVGHYRRRRRREFLDFMNRLVAQYPDTELHVVLDNLNTHKPKHDRWLARHPQVHFHYTPTHASWLNQVEVWFSILTRAVLRGLSATDPRQVCAAINRFTAARNERPVPFEWTKAVVYPVGLTHRYADLRK